MPFAEVFAVLTVALVDLLSADFPLVSLALPFDSLSVELIKREHNKFSIHLLRELESLTADYSTYTVHCNKALYLSHIQ